ncbi:MAG: hypothetical protein Hyperionvirus6_43 [Hyperionvirus sp.]|uniref:Uncharacterized protein n=1 Tax=Hyperionvirus sp. TaxID=2487770 RepID=A0A3G5A8F3_9VIRU|nr:MAG: hypothetical protein Hyperionvirus6_43 [Hyperionvirus sp.]
MTTLLEYIRIFNADDAKLFEVKCLDQRRVDIYSKICEGEKHACLICYLSFRKRGSYCGECNAMLYVHELVKGAEMESGERKEEYKNWKDMFENKERQRKNYFAISFFKYMSGGAQSAPATLAPGWGLPPPPISVGPPTFSLGQSREPGWAPRWEWGAPIRGPSGWGTSAIAASGGKASEQAESESAAKAAARPAVSAAAGSSSSSSSRIDTTPKVRRTAAAAAALIAATSEEESTKSLKRSSHPEDDDNYNEDTLPPRKVTKRKNKCKIHSCAKRGDEILCDRHRDCKICIECNNYRAAVKIDGEICQPCRDKKAGKDRKKGLCRVLGCRKATGELLLCEKHKDFKKCTTCCKYKQDQKEGETCLACSQKAAEIKEEDSSRANLEKLKNLLRKNIIYDNEYANTDSLRKYVWHNMYNEIDDNERLELAEWCEENSTNCAVMLCLADIYAMDDCGDDYKELLESATKFKLSEPYLLLGNYYSEINKPLAIFNYKKAVELGNSEAMFWLSKFDAVEIRAMWLYKSAKCGHMRAFSVLTDLEIKTLLEERISKSVAEFNKWLGYLKRSKEKEARNRICTVLAKFEKVEGVVF